ncbi:hypothetical protein HBI56_065860 [Parastagonospora nodorum]|nr:hypothetical protein HBH52_109630 [Parastagonospora nodorum]KAH4035840.1 hypothetical protein HBI09_092650 [Parastagonospora nodorum]KAH4068880.1 hypothetical protein HBH50_120210 [Parastagonospora nodorum]KAH4100470.1 hypothetical protein HBH48_021750 [Parastagonospora nodorum]KAH4403479.1 hypothetical protein HBH93_236850 [Parastagonospora nodorum]
MERIPKKHSPRIVEGEWKAHRNTIFRLYVVENRPLTSPGGVKDIMTIRYNFTATKAQYETRLKKWGFHKYRSANNRHPTLSKIGEGSTQDNACLISRDIPFRTPSPYQRMLQVDRPNLPSIVTSSVSTAVNLGRRLTSELDLELIPVQQRGRMSINYPHTTDSINSMWHGHLERDAVPSTYSSAIHVSGQFITSDVFPGERIADDLHGRNHIGSSSFNGTLAGSPLVETAPSGNIFIIDIADALMPTISRLAHTAIPSTHMALSMGRALFQSAIGSVHKIKSNPRTSQLICQQTIEYQIIYTILHRLINDSAIGSVLGEPNTPFDKLLRAGMEHMLSLGAQVLGTMVDSVPALYRPALIQGLFLAALVMSNGSVLRALLDRTNLATQALFFSDSEEYPLEYACRMKDLVAAEILLERGADPNKYAQQAPTANLFYREGHEEHNVTDIKILRLLLRYGLLGSEYDHRRILEFCSKEELLWLVAHDLDLACLLFVEEALLPLLLLRSDWDDDLSEMFKMFLKQGNLNATIPRDLWKHILTESLSTAVLLEYRSEVMMLLEIGTEPDVGCLISAALCEDLEILERFLDLGIDPNSPVILFSGNRSIFSTAVSVSIAHESPEVFKILEERDCISKLTKDPYGIVPALVAACETGNADLVGRLLALPDLPRSWEKMLADSAHTDSLERVFHIAIEAGHESICHKLLSRGFNPRAHCLDAAYRNRQPKLIELLTNVVDPTVETFRVAMKTGKRKDLEDLLHLGVPIDECFELKDDDIDSRDLTTLFPFEHNWGTTLLGVAIMAQNEVAVEVLITYGAQVNRSRGFPRWSLLSGGYNDSLKLITAVTACVIRRNIRLLIELFREGADPFDNRAIYVAAVHGLEDVVKLLLLEFKRQYPRGSTSFGHSALLWAVHAGNLSLIETLVTEVNTSGLVDAKTLVSEEKSPHPFRRLFPSGRSLLRIPTMTPASNRSIPPPPPPVPPFRESPSYPVLASVRLMLTSPIGEAIRMECAKDCPRQVLHLILPWTKDLNGVVAEDTQIGNLTALLYAIRLDCLETVQTLFKAGADLSFPARRGINRTALQTATEVGNEEIVKYLLRQHVSPNEPPAARSGATSLQLAAIKGYVGLASILMDAGAEVNAEPALQHGRTAFEGATEHGRIEMMVFLVQRGADLLSNNWQQHRRAVLFAKENGQHASIHLADDLLKKVLESLQASGPREDGNRTSPAASEFGADQSVWSVSEFVNDTEFDVGF